jgi:1-acyl-sn-glycerol-3-phosphate acyltransferase
MMLMTTVLARPEILGLDRLADLARLDDPPPLIFAPDHHSHLDTSVMIQAIPPAWRRDLVVAAAADYFFDKRWKATFSALALNAIPIDREATGRQSADLFRDLIDEGRSLLIYPEGGRSPDGWAQPFKGGAAYLSAKTGVAVVPVHIEGTGAIFGKGMKKPRPGRTRVIFGEPLLSLPDENTRRYNARIEAAVGRLTEESVSDYWTAARKASAGTANRLEGPSTSSWRRKWLLTERRHREISGRNSRPERSWPNLGPRQN